MNPPGTRTPLFVMRASERPLPPTDSRASSRVSSATTCPGASCGQLETEVKAKRRGKHWREFAPRRRQPAERGAAGCAAAWPGDRQRRRCEVHGGGARRPRASSRPGCRDAVKAVQCAVPDLLGPRAAHSGCCGADAARMRKRPRLGARHGRGVRHLVLRTSRSRPDAGVTRADSDHASGPP